MIADSDAARGRLLIALFAIFSVSCTARAQLQFQYLTEIGNGFGSGPGQFNQLSGIVAGDFDHNGLAEVLFVADTGNSRIQRISFDPMTGAPSFDVVAGPGTALGQVMHPKGVDVDSKRGALYVADTGNNRVQVLPASIGAGPPPAIVLGPGSGLLEVEAPHDVLAWSVEPRPGLSDFLMVADTGRYDLRLIEFDEIGNIVIVEDLTAILTEAAKWPPIIDLILNSLPRLLPADRYRLYLDEDGAERLILDFTIQQGRPIEMPEPAPIEEGSYDSGDAGTAFRPLLEEAGTELGQTMRPEATTGFVWGPHSYYFVADTGNNRIQLGLDNGISIDWSLLAGPGSGPGQVMSPGGLALGDLTGDGRLDLIVADAGNSRILVFAGVPEPTTMALVAAAAAGLGIRRRCRLAGQSRTPTMRITHLVADCSTFLGAKLDVRIRPCPIVGQA
jgi:hypothetical protein